MIIGLVVALCYFVPYFYIAAFLTEVGCVIKIVSSDDNPDYKVPWLLFVLILPIAGFMLYFIFSSRTLKKKYVKRLNTLKAISYKSNDKQLLSDIKEQNPVAYSQIKMITEIADTHVFDNTKLTYFPSGEIMLKSLLDDLKRAEKFIYMEYFIIEDGAFWSQILDVLKDKAVNGVEIKLVWDDIGCMSTLPGNYTKILKKYGIEATPFSRLKGSADSEFNNRNHRKITVIDGKVGYTGGINIADEYINAVQRFGHWKDTALRLEGAGVYELTKLFLTDYGINVKGDFKIKSELFPESKISSERGYVVPFGDGPNPIYQRRVGKSVIQNMLAAATDYAYMTSPYLIIDNDLCTCIENAALRGVDVKIIVPHIPDKKMVFGMTRSFYSRLMNAGVKIYEYTPGFIHAKSYVVDDKFAMIGTINLDYRSLVHHFENGVFMYDTAAVADIKADIESTLEECEIATEKAYKINFVKKFIRAVVRIFAPLM